MVYVVLFQPTKVVLEMKRRIVLLKMLQFHTSKFPKQTIWPNLHQEYLM